MDPEQPTPVKRRRGRPRKHPKPEEATLTIPADPGTVEAGVEWAEAVLWAAERVNNAKLTVKTAGSLMRHTFWKFGRDDPKALLVTLVPKALAILDKTKKGAEDTEILAAEASSIADLEELLDGALEEAGLKV